MSELITIDQLLEMPALPKLLDTLRERLAAEQERRVAFREWLTEDSKAEFINGQVVMHTPASDDHNAATGQLYRIASLYADLKQLGKVRIEKAMIGLDRNDYEPNIAFWRKEIADQFDPGMSVYPVPDLIVEVLSPGKENIRRDTVTKFADYAAHRVAEYWIIDPKKQTVEQYLLAETENPAYELRKKATLEDQIESMVMTGLSIPVRAIFETEANTEAVLRLLDKR
jgi:Uma2 family endonuclease